MKFLYWKKDDCISDANTFYRPVTLQFIVVQFVQVDCSKGLVKITATFYEAKDKAKKLKNCILAKLRKSFFFIYFGCIVRCPVFWQGFMKRLAENLIKIKFNIFTPDIIIGLRSDIWCTPKNRKIYKFSFFFSTFWFLNLKKRDKWAKKIKIK